MSPRRYPLPLKFRWRVKTSTLYHVASGPARRNCQNTSRPVATFIIDRVKAQHHATTTLMELVCGGIILYPFKETIEQRRIGCRTADEAKHPYEK